MHTPAAYPHLSRQTQMATLGTFTQMEFTTQTTAKKIDPPLIFCPSLDQPPSIQTAIFHQRWTLQQWGI